MAKLECLVSKTFTNLEVFLKQVAALDIFEALMFNYKVKIDLNEPVSIHFFTFVSELANQLQLVIAETNSVHQRPLSSEYNATSDELESKFVDIDETRRKIASISEIPLASPEQSTKKKKQFNRRKNTVRRRRSPRKLTVLKTEKRLDRTLLFKSLSSSKVDLVVAEARGLSGDEEDTELYGDVFSTLPFFLCDTCQGAFKTMAEYDQHKCKELDTTEDGVGVFTHQVITCVDRLRLAKSFKCGLCHEEYRSYDRIVYHLPRCVGGPYSCQLCSQMFTTKKQVYDHKKNAHRNEKCYFCDECDVSFKLRTSLMKHQVKRHEQHQEKFPCAYCTLTFDKRIRLTNHNLTVHALEKKFLCQMCGKRFINQNSLTAHMLVHTEPKRFACTYCDRKFEAKEKLMFHTRIHTGERPHLCQACGKGFIRKSKLDEHQRRHTGEKRFRCNACDKVYANNCDLKMHNKKQHPTVSSTENQDQIPTKNPTKKPNLLQRDKLHSAPPVKQHEDSSDTDIILNDSIESQIVMMESNNLPGQSLIVVNSMPAEKDDSRILVQFADRPNSRRVFLHLDQTNPNAILAVSDNVAGLGDLSQYIQIQAENAGAGDMPLVQFPAQATEAAFGLHQMQSEQSIVYTTAGFDVNNITF